MAKNLIITLFICISCCAVAIAETKTPIKQKGLFSNYFEKAKTWGNSYKSQLELKYFKERLKKTPDDIELLKTYAKYLKDHKYYDEALTTYKKLIDLTKNDDYKKDMAEIKSFQGSQKKEQLFSDYINQAKKYENQGDIVKANEYYFKAQKVDPERYEAKFGLAKTYCWLNQPKLAIKKYKELLKQSPNNIDLLEAYAKCLYDYKELAQAKEIYNKLFALTKNEKYNSNLQEIISLERGYTPKLKNAELTHNAEQSNAFSEYLKQAQRYESQGKISKANEYYLKAQKEAPNRYEAKFGLAKTFGWLHQNKIALAYYKELIKESPNNPNLLAAYNKFLKENRYQAKPTSTNKGTTLQSSQTQKPNAGKDNAFSDYLKRAQDYEKQGKTAEANNYYIKAGEIYPSRFETKFGLAKTYGWLHKDALALKYYKELLAQSPDNADLLVAYANYLKDNKDYSGAMGIYNKLLAKSKDDKDVKYEKYQANIAEIYFLQKDYKISLKLYFELYAKNPDNLEIQKAIALSYFVSGDFEKSNDFYQKYLAKDCDSESLLNYGKSLFYSKKVQQAKEILQNYVNAYPRDVNGLSTLADIYMATNDTSKAIALVNRGLLIEPNNIKLRIQTAKIDIAAKNYCQAQNLLLKLLAIEPNNVEIIENLGDISFYTADFNQALCYYQNIPDFKTNPRLIYKIAQSFHYGKNYAVAQCLYKQILNDPEYSNKSKIGLAEIEISKNKPLNARKILNNVLANDPENIQAKKNMGISYFSTGDNYKSIQILEPLPKDDTDITYNLAKAYNGIDRRDKALELLNDNPQDNAKALKGEIQMQIKPAIEPLSEGFFMNAYGNPNAGQYLKLGGNAYYYIKPNMRLVGTATTTEYRNASNIVATRGTLGSIGLEGIPNDHLSYKSAFGIDFFSNNGQRILGNAVVKYSPNDFVNCTTGYIRSLDEIDSYMSAAGVVPSVGPFANQLVGRIIDNKFVVANFGFKLPHKFYAYAGFNAGYKYGSNSAPNAYREIPAGFGKVIYSAPENRPINQAILAYDFYYTGYVNDMSGFGGANLAYSPIGSDGQQTFPTTGFAGTGGYFSPTFFVANKIPLTIKGSFKNTKLKYILSGYMGTQTIQGQLPIAGIGNPGTSKLNVFPYFGCVVGIRYNEKGRCSWALDYIFNNYMTVAQHTLRASVLVRF